MGAHGQHVGKGLLSPKTPAGKKRLNVFESNTHLVHLHQQKWFQHLQTMLKGRQEEKAVHFIFSFSHSKVSSTLIHFSVPKSKGTQRQTDGQRETHTDGQRHTDRQTERQTEEKSISFT